MKKVKGRFLLVLFAGLLGTVNCFAASEPEFQNEDLPAIWENVKPRMQLTVLRTATVDAYTLLAESIYGLPVYGETNVYDLTLESDKIRTSIHALLKGAAETEKPKYTESGIVYVYRGVRVRDVYEIIKKEVKKFRDGSVVISLEKEKNHEDKLIEAIGMGALPGSKGMQRLRARRAAYLDAYRLMAERLKGVMVKRFSEVDRFFLKNDHASASLEATIKGLKPIKETYNKKGIYSVTLQMTRLQIIETIRKFESLYRLGGKTKSESKEDISSLVTEKTYTETGHGSPTSDIEEAAPKSISEAIDTRELFRMEHTVVRRILLK